MVSKLWSTTVQREYLVPGKYYYDPRGDLLGCWYNVNNLLAQTLRVI